MMVLLSSLLPLAVLLIPRGAGALTTIRSASVRCHHPATLQFSKLALMAVSDDSKKNIGNWNPEVIVTRSDSLKQTNNHVSVASNIALLLTLFAAAPAEAASSTPSVSSAMAAYGHYLGILVMTISLVAERLTIKPNMSEDEDTQLLITDTVYGIAAVLVLYTGYLRATEYGKGWDFYSHEPIFWVKMSLFAILGASSLFNTANILQREFFASGSSEEPRSDELVQRMTTIVNGELLAMISIPLAATTMSRGIGYTDSIPWQAGAVVTVTLFVGLGAKYVFEAVNWKEENS